MKLQQQIGSTMSAVYYEPRHYNNTCRCMAPGAYAYIGPNGLKRLFAKREDAVDSRNEEYKDAGMFDEMWHDNCDAA